MRRIMHPRWGLHRIAAEVLLPVFRQTYEDTLAAADSLSTGNRYQEKVVRGARGG
jgi:hypothetical protein